MQVLVSTGTIVGDDLLKWQTEFGLRKVAGSAVCAVPRPGLRDARMLARAESSVGGVPVNASCDQLRVDLARFAVDSARQSINKLDPADALRCLSNIIRPHRILLPSVVSLLSRPRVVLEGTAQKQHPDPSLGE